MLASPFVRGLRFTIFFSSIGHLVSDRFAVSKTQSYSGRCSAASADRCEFFIASGASQFQISAQSSACLGNSWMFNTLRLVELDPRHEMLARLAGLRIPLVRKYFGEQLRSQQTNACKE